ncbi:MAG: hypothetical protein IJ793_03115 [Opitutales bacterium]|nr:hypothetical protein [Opitutales bacterium]
MKTYKLHLSPYGTFEHPEGLQSISSADAQRCIRKTRTWRFRLGLKKIPVYLGHPDDPLFKSEHSDPRIYGYVKNLCADKDGLWVSVKFTKYGRIFLSKSPRHYLSPRWVLCKTENQTAYHPERLLSVGLTQHPNLPVQPIVFEVSTKKSFGLRTLLRFLKKRQISSKTSRPQKSNVHPDSGFRKSFATFIKHLRQTFVAKIKQATPTVDTQSPTPLPTSDEDPFSGHRTPLSSDLHGTQTREEKRRILQFGQAVRARMKATGESYPEAWNVLLHQTPSVFTNNRPNATEGEHSEPPTARPKRNNFVPRSLKPKAVTENS